MKKIMKSLIVVMVILSMSMTVFAVESPTESVVVAGVVEGASVDDEGNWVDVVVEHVDEELLAEIEYINETTELKALLGDSYTEGMEVVEIREVYIEGDQSLISWPVTIVFDVEGVTADTDVQVLHYTEGAWEIVDATAGAGTITASFESLSPVAFVIGETSATSGSTATSPETGEVNMIAIATVVAGLALVVAYTTRKKEAK